VDTSLSLVTETLKRRPANLIPARVFRHSELRSARPRPARAQGGSSTSVSAGDQPEPVRLRASICGSFFGRLP